MGKVKSKPLILCVDDYEHILYGWKLLLENEDYQVLTAKDGGTALQLFACCPFDEVIIDYQLPGDTGAVVASKMKMIRPSVPILLVSGEGSFAREEFTSVDAFLLKNEPVRTFLSVVKELLVNSSMARAS